MEQQWCRQPWDGSVGTVRWGETKIIIKYDAFKIGLWGLILGKFAQKGYFIKLGLFLQISELHPMSSCTLFLATEERGSEWAGLPQFRPSNSVLLWEEGLLDIQAGPVPATISRIFESLQIMTLLCVWVFFKGSRISITGYLEVISYWFPTQPHQHRWTCSLCFAVEKAVYKPIKICDGAILWTF